MQDNAPLAITVGIRGTSQKKIYKKIGLESLKLIGCLKGLCMFYIIKTFHLPEYLYCLISSDHHHYNTGNLDLVETTIAELLLLNIYFFLIQFLNEINSIHSCTMPNLKSVFENPLSSRSIASQKTYTWFKST